MKLIKYIRDFWLDFFAAKYQRLMRNAKYETSTSMIMHTSFTQAVNLNTLLVLFITLFLKIELTFVILFIPILFLIGLNFYLFSKLNNREKENLLNRKAKYKTFVYDLYDVFSTVLFVMVLILFSEVRN